MDVVKTNIEKLSGEVKVITEIGKGSKFKVVLPLTLAIIEAMITKIGDERYIIPLGQVYESLSPTADIVHHVNGVGDCLKIRGKLSRCLKFQKLCKEILMKNHLMSRSQSSLIRMREVLLF